MPFSCTIRACRRPSCRECCTPQECAIERHLLSVHGEKVLTEEVAYMFEIISEVADDRIVSPDGVFGLGDVCDIDADEEEYE